MGNRQLQLQVPTVDLSGKVAIVTGGNTGIGYEVVKGLAEMGAHTIMASRSEERATAAIAQLKEESSDKDLKVEFMHLDLASIQSTKDFVRAFKEKNLPLHILINNAAIAMIPFTITKDGNEMQFQVNHLCPFLLTLELVPTMLETASTSGDGRILFVSSFCHEECSQGPITFDSINSEPLYSRIKGYCLTKLYNVMTAFAFQRKLKDVSITVSAQNPGPTRSTGLGRGFSDSCILTFFSKILLTVAGRTPQQGAATILNCAVNPELNSQQALYYSDCQESTGNPQARNEQYQEELWRRSVDVLQDHLSPEILEKYAPSIIQ